MKVHSQKERIVAIQRIGLVAGGVLINVVLSYISFRLDIPLYFDTIGTIAVAATGFLFPAILTAVLTNLFCLTFNVNAMYFAAINAVIAIGTTWFVRRHGFKKLGRTVLFALSIALFSGFFSSFIQWALFGDAQQSIVADSAHSISAAMNAPYISAFFLTNILFNILDKGITVAVVAFGYRFVPEKWIRDIVADSLRQRPLSTEESRAVKKMSRSVKFSIRTRMVVTLVVTVVIIIVSMSWIGMNIYYEDMRNERTETARGITKLVAEMVDASKMDYFLEYGENADGYKDVEDMMYKIKNATPNVQYLYILRVKEDGCHFIFDLDANGEEGYEPGEVVPFDEEFVPYVADLMAGREVAAIESINSFGHTITTYYPVHDKYGNTLCHVGADISVEYMDGFLRDLTLRIILILSGLFILVVAYALWTTKIYVSYPISTMATVLDSFANGGDDQDQLDANVKTIRSIDIRTGDEAEKLYKSLCRMTIDQAEQMRGIRRLSESTAKMQDGLIITMADMVENRDSDTGAHVQKTAAYAKIIVEGLLKKGYYAEKITPKFMSDVVRSAPLHDVGKINIPDGVLNKPGKLTDEEYAIMKTHTTAGKKILENAISTVQGESYLKEARNMAAYHHERWDGKGYPEGIHGEVIPLSARIMAVADVFDALTSQRIYKPPFPLDKALSIMQEAAGTQFDPKCIEVFMEAMPEVKLVLRKYNG